jgi:hypothetical protein
VSSNTISLNHQILTLGSCFSDVIGEQLKQSKFCALANPLGVIYNPMSLHKALRYIIYNEPVPAHTYTQLQDIYLNYDFHSEFSSLDRSLLELKLTNTIGSLHHFLHGCEWLIITYGTAWTYERLDTGEVVTNCHKKPAKEFKKVLLTEQQILESFQELYHDLKTFNPAIKIILTVSPVRHIKDTLPLNSVSKSILRLACHKLSERYGNVEYFPSYEIMIDELRDYRFYKEDMIHPTAQAEEYIWEKFTSCYLDSQTQKFISDWKNIRTALHHRPFHPTSLGHQNFIKQTIEKLEELKAIVNVDNEIQSLKSQLI